jgi:hypothetical protein
MGSGKGTGFSTISGWVRSLGCANPSALAVYTWASAAKRQAVNQGAVERSEALDMARLALTVDVKWGSYDHDAILPADKESPGPGGTFTSTS